MRALSLCLFASMLTGCSLHHPSPPVSNKPVLLPPGIAARNKPAAPRPSQVSIYTDASTLDSRPFRDLGEVFGESCQSSRQDSPPDINTARKRLQVRAASIKANAVLLHQCEIVTTTTGCYRQAVCQGSALQVNQ